MFAKKPNNTRTPPFAHWAQCILASLSLHPPDRETSHEKTTQQPPTWRLMLGKPVVI